MGFILLIRIQKLKIYCLLDQHASGSWNGVRSINGNDQQLSLSNNTPHRMVGILGYKIQYGGKFAATSINLGYIGEQSSSFITYGGDLNGDRGNQNDLLFVPNKASDLRFVTQTLGDLYCFFYIHCSRTRRGLKIR
jgi:hypothetical protein